MGSPYPLDPGSDAADLEAAVAAAREAFPGWKERSRLLLRIAEGIQAEGEPFARVRTDPLTQ
jgi:aldehyde dehydrogenase (NAD+)